MGWARLHRVRQFQFFGIPSRQVWRELRRLASQMARNPEGPQRLKDDAMDAVLAAADAGCFATYIEKQGGVLIPRKDYLIRTAYDLADELNDYGEQSVQIYGIWSPLIGESSRVCTHPDNWKLVRRKPDAEDHARENGFDLQGDPVAPWTRGNNCPRTQNGNPTATESQQPDEAAVPRQWPEMPPDTPVGDWLKSLKPHERRALMRSLRAKPADNDNAHILAAPPAPSSQDAPGQHASQWRKVAGELGLKLSDDHIQHLSKAGVLHLNGHVLNVTDGRLTHRRDQHTDRKVNRIWERLSRNHGVRASEIRYNPLAHYVDMLRNIGVEALPGTTTPGDQGDESQ
ncbi:putative phage replication protein [Escherichia coli M056]|nr:putative phage replication protein [Escherichia coli M056]